MTQLSVHGKIVEKKYSLAVLYSVCSMAVAKCKC